MIPKSSFVGVTSKPEGPIIFRFNNRLVSIANLVKPIVSWICGALTKKMVGRFIIPGCISDFKCYPASVEPNELPVVIDVKFKTFSNAEFAIDILRLRQPRQSVAT